MKITNITTDGQFYDVTFSPNWLQKLFGMKPRVLRYRRSGNYKRFPNLISFYSSDGKILNPLSNVCAELNAYHHKF